MRSSRLAAALTLPVLLGLLAALVPSLAAEGQAPGRPGLSISARLSPLPAGTEAAPRPARLRLGMQLTAPAVGDEAPVAELAVLLPKGIALDGTGYPVCVRRALELEGPSACPKRSALGRALGTVESDGETGRLRMRLFNGGPSRVYGYATLGGPVKVTATVPFRIERTRSGRWRHRLIATMPRALRSAVGMPILLRSLELDVGKGAKGSRHRGRWLATTGCPKARRLPFQVIATLEQGKAARKRGSMRCR